MSSLFTVVRAKVLDPHCVHLPGIRFSATSIKGVAVDRVNSAASALRRILLMENSISIAKLNASGL